MLPASDFPHRSTVKLPSSWRQANVRETEKKSENLDWMTQIRRRNYCAGKKITEVVKKQVDNLISACYNAFIFDCFTMVEW